MVLGVTRAGGSPYDRQPSPPILREEPRPRRPQLDWNEDRLEAPLVQENCNSRLLRYLGYGAKMVKVAVGFCSFVAHIIGSVRIEREETPPNEGAFAEEGPARRVFRRRGAQTPEVLRETPVDLANYGAVRERCRWDPLSVALALLTALSQDDEGVREQLHFIGNDCQNLPVEAYTDTDYTGDPTPYEPLTPAKKCEQLMTHLLRRCHLQEREIACIVDMMGNFEDFEAIRKKIQAFNTETDRLAGRKRREGDSDFSYSIIPVLYKAFADHDRGIHLTTSDELFNEWTLLIATQIQAVLSQRELPPELIRLLQKGREILEGDRETLRVNFSLLRDSFAGYTRFEAY